MRTLGASSAIAVALMLTGAIHAPAALADDTGAAKAPPAAIAADPPPPPAPPPACDSLWNFVATSCPLTWYGITLYGTIDMGGTWLSRGTHFSFTGLSPPGQEYLLSKNSDHPRWGVAPNALTNSNIGIKGNEEFAPGWAFIFDLQAGFDPYTFRLSDGPGSIAQNAGVPLTRQTANTDSSRAGQFYNSVGYMGVSSPTYGTLTIFRQNALTLDGVFEYDPLSASYAFSPLGYQGTTCGAGDTEDCRFSTALKYRVGIGPFRAAALYQFGGYELNNAAQGAYQFGVGGDIHDVAGGVLSLDGIYSNVKDAVGISLAGNTLPALLPQTLTATISNDHSWMALARYTKGPVKLFAGYEWIQFGNPSDPQTAFNDISGNRLCIGCAGINNTNISNTTYSAHNKILNIFWVGARYALTDELTLIGAYYQYLQNNFGAGAPCHTEAKATCSGLYNALAFVVDWQFAAKFDAYAGLMYQTVENGLANGFLHHNLVDPTVGLRFRF
jgi:predicted porin